MAHPVSGHADSARRRGRRDALGMGKARLLGAIT
jgi:hypothetical protein